MTHFKQNLLKSVFVLIVFSHLTQCTHPIRHLESHAQQHNLRSITFNHNHIDLKGYINHDNTPNKTVYIYLEGDGRPWDSYWPAKNPNTLNSTSLPLMTQGKRDALYLLRPCYGWRNMPANCNNTLWTSARYSQQVVELLNKAIEQHQQQYKPQRYIIVGHSGGATLALLLAAQRADVAAVISLAGNLDHKAWTDYFGYLPLSQSLAPLAREYYPATQMHWYLIGKKDKVVPPQLQTQAITDSPNNIVKYYADFSHQCCWQTIWPALLNEVEQTLGL